MMQAAQLGVEPFQSTRPVRGATSCSPTSTQHTAVSIHAPRAGRDADRRPTAKLQDVFQSTRPVRGATPAFAHFPFGGIGFNPRAPCGARPIVSILFSCPLLFQSTRPVRGATSGCHHIHVGSRFQSTRPVRGATFTDVCTISGDRVSIHAPRAGRDPLHAVFRLSV